jgi:hypothetical protein
MRVMSDFDAMPTLRLTLPQAMRLWTLDQPMCEAVLHTLVEVEFLERDGWGQYVKSPPDSWRKIKRCSWRVVPH